MIRICRTGGERDCLPRHRRRRRRCRRRGGGRGTCFPLPAAPVKAVSSPCVQPPLQATHGCCNLLNPWSAAALGDRPLSRASLQLLPPYTPLALALAVTTLSHDQSSQPTFQRRSNNHYGADLDQAGLGLAAVMNVLFSLCKTWLREGQRGEVSPLLVRSPCSAVQCSSWGVPGAFQPGAFLDLPALPPPSPVFQMLRSNAPHTPWCQPVE